MSKKPKKPRKQPPEMSQIIEEWDKWTKNKVPEGEKGTAQQGLEFYGYLKTEKQELLDFKFAGDRWQQVKVWLREVRGIAF